MSEETETWWKEAVVYQVYPQSFQDTDGDGVGDIQGIRERVDYIDDLGVDVVWCNPLYASPHVDDGYDISDYRAIRPEYGTMADFEALLKDLHNRGIKLVMDLVVNHTSDEHEWFERSKDPESEYHDYYHWVDGHPDEPPSNWTSGFGGSAWTWDEDVGKWYLHLFHERQPDLNWEHPAVRDEVFDMMNWWLERGIDGFRMDVINLISKPDGYPDGDPDSGWVGVEHFAEGPRVHEFLSTMDERVLSQHDGIFTIGETIGVDVPEADRYAADGLDTVFHFDHVTLDFDEFEGWWRVRDWSLPELKDIWGRWQTHPEEAWPSAYLGNHDWPRTVSRWGDDDEYRYESATALGTLVLTSRGTPFVFQGDELGMTNYPFESVDELRDADATNRIEEAIEAGDIEGFDEVRDLVRYRSRDNARTPMQWDGSENAGFTDGEPWINVNPNYEWLNAAADRKAEASIFEHFQRLVDLRHDHDTLVYGEYDDLLPHDDRVWAYLRTRDGDGFLVVLNLSTEETTVELPARARFERSELVVDNYVTATNPEDLARPLTLRPYEARVYRQSD